MEENQVKIVLVLCNIYFETLISKPMEIEDQHVSLSKCPSSMNKITTQNKVLLVREIQDELGKIPHFLTKQNESFKQKSNQMLSIITKQQLNSTDQVDELRKIAILIYKTMVIESYQLLWTTYLKSGLGQLTIESQQKQSIIYPTNLPIWPKELKNLFSLSKSNTKNTDVNEQYLRFVKGQLNELEHQLKQYQIGLSVKSKNCNGYKLLNEKIIETYIEENFLPFRIKIQHKIELIYYDYHIQALKLEYFRYHPNDQQV